MFILKVDIIEGDKMKTFLASIVLMSFGLLSDTFCQPAITTLIPDSVTSSSAVLRATCYPNGLPTEVHFHLDRKPLGICPIEKIYFLPQLIPGDTTPVEISYRVSGLFPNATYHCRAGARYADSVEYVHGDDVLFTTLIDSSTRGFAIPLSFKYGGASGTRWFGVHTLATYCIDAEFGECELPPLPPYPGDDCRFVDPRIVYSFCTGQGLYTDLRHYYSEAQVDTYKIKFQTPNSTVIFSWPNLSNYYKGSVRLVDLFGGLVVNTDMKAKTSDTISTALGELYIIAEGPANLLGANFAYLSNNKIMLNGLYNPNGVQAQGWFEWGLTNSYGNSTPKIDITGTTNVVTFSDSITNLLADTNYHYHAVIQDQNGTIYGIDQSFEVPATPTAAPGLTGFPSTFVLRQNYPNPFNPSTTIEFDLPTASLVTIKVYNILGQEIKTLLKEVQYAGRHSLSFDGTNLTTGVYFYRLTTGTYSSVRKMVLIR